MYGRKLEEDGSCNVSASLPLLLSSSICAPAHLQSHSQTLLQTAIHTPFIILAMDINYSYFNVVAHSGVPAMHAAVLPPTGQVVFLDKVEDYSELRLPNDHWAYSSMYDPDTQQLTPLSVATNPFCCGGSFLADGRLLTAGGNAPLLWLDPTVDDGFDAVRYLSNENGTYQWKEPGNKLASNRWYASAQTLADGRVFVAAGSLNAQSQMNFSNNNPTYEILDEKGVSEGENIPMNILVDTMPY